jgi:16S rRNA G966 N2-methylase RsmD
MASSKNIDFDEEDVIEITQEDLAAINKGKKKKNIIKIDHYFKPLPGVDQKKIRLTNISICSTTPWKEADYISRSIDNQMKFLLKGEKPYHRQQVTITDATANIGGNTLGFYLYGFGQVNAVEIDPLTCDILKTNLEVYGWPTSNVYCRDYLEIFQELNQDVVFIDPPWGGPDYKKAQSLDLYLGKTNIIDICRSLMATSKTKLIVLKLPINYNLTGLIQGMPKTKHFLTIKIFRYGCYHSYNIVFCY